MVLCFVVFGLPVIATGAIATTGDDVSLPVPVKSGAARESRLMRKGTKTLKNIVQVQIGSDKVGLAGDNENHNGKETKTLNNLVQVQIGSDASTATGAALPEANAPTWRIPRQLVLTGRAGSFEELNATVKAKFERLIEQEPGMVLRWLNDKDCERYLLDHFPEPAKCFSWEPRGAFRGDICRTAVLLREGGFYLDLDVELHIRLMDLVDESTTFMSVFESGEDDPHPGRPQGALGILNAVIAVEPESPVMRHTLFQLVKWYRNETLASGESVQTGLMGPTTLARGLSATLASDCPAEDLTQWRQQSLTRDAKLQRTCGPHVLRLYVQKRIRCTAADIFHQPVLCANARRAAYYDGLQFALFKPGPAGALIGFPRPEWCKDPGCGLGGNVKRWR